MYITIYEIGTINRFKTNKNIPREVSKKKRSIKNLRMVFCRLLVTLLRVINVIVSFRTFGNVRHDKIDVIHMLYNHSFRKSRARHQSQGKYYNNIRFDTRSSVQRQELTRPEKGSQYHRARFVLKRCRCYVFAVRSENLTPTCLAKNQLGEYGNAFRVDFFFLSVQVRSRES